MSHKIQDSKKKKKLNKSPLSTSLTGSCVMAGFSLRRLGFNPEWLHVRFMVKVLALELLFFPTFFGFPLPIVILPLIHPHLPPFRELYGIPNQADYYHVLGAND
jgi:hypothetical protein